MQSVQQGAALFLKTMAIFLIFFIYCCHQSNIITLTLHNIIFVSQLLLFNSAKEVLSQVWEKSHARRVAHLKETEPIVWIQSFTGHRSRLEP